MFKRTQKLPQRKGFNLTLEEIVDDINKVSKDSEQRRKLYLSVDDKEPSFDSRFAKIEEFLEGGEHLENVILSLNDMCDELNALEKQLKSGSNHLREMVEETLKEVKGIDVE